jgi:hypothetical protein
MLSLESLNYVALSHKACHHCRMPLRGDARERAKTDRNDAELRVHVVPDSQYPLHVVRRDGVPEMPMTVFANELRRELAAGSAYNYVREVVQFANWAMRDHVAATQGWSLYGEPREIRNLLQEYLSNVGQCRVTRRPDTLGIRVAYVNGVDGTRMNVRLLLAALKRFYEILSDACLYSFPNPLVHADARRAITEFRRQGRVAVEAFAGRPPMPPASGVDPPEDVRLSENYFRLVRREWQPRAIDDPEFPGHVYAAGARHGWALREFCVARALLESGARISEIFDLTAADWSFSGFGNQLSARSKGSFGERVKTLVVSNPTAKLFRRYFDQHRRERGKPHLTISDLNRMQRKEPEQLSRIRIFLTQRGTAMTPGLFRDHYWRPALRAAGLDADPHTCRHWFVTNAMRHIEQAAANEAELARRKEELIQYMAWRSGERTLKAYEHLERGRSFAMRLQVIHREMRRRERRSAAQPTDQAATMAISVGQQDLLFLLGQDDDD